MAKRVHAASFSKAELNLNWDEGKLIIAETTKDGAFEYNLNEVLNEFVGKTISLTIKEEGTIAPIDEFNVSSDGDGYEEADFFKED